MPKIRVQNFGPIKDNETWINIGKVTLLVGNQGSGKSTIAKLISTFTWIEKALNRGDHNIKFFERKSKFRNAFLTYHRIQNYLNADTQIEYIGNSYEFKYNNGSLKIYQLSNPNPEELPQIMYVPAERNFLTYIESFKELKVSSPSLREFRDEYKNAQKSIKGTYDLPINGIGLEYDRQNDILHLRGNNYRLRISEASSGYQSIVPLYIVSLNLAQSVLKGDEYTPMSEDERERFRKLFYAIANDPKFTEDQRRSAMSTLTTRFKKTAFINIVEEPEQNLFPSSQWDLLSSLLRINNMSAGNQLIMTTHSPYIINYLTLFIKAYQIKQKCKSDKIMQQLYNIVPSDSLVEPKKIFIYELNGQTGIYSQLEDYKGIPSDDNYLNNGLADSNVRFAKLLDIEDICSK